MSIFISTEIMCNEEQKTALSYLIEAKVKTEDCLFFLEKIEELAYKLKEAKALHYDLTSAQMFSALHAEILEQSIEEMTQGLIINIINLRPLGYLKHALIIACIVVEGLGYNKALINEVKELLKDL